MGELRGVDWVRCPQGAIAAPAEGQGEAIATGDEREGGEGGREP
jgi:hypothetical protein